MVYVSSSRSSNFYPPPPFGTTRNPTRNPWPANPPPQGPRKEKDFTCRDCLECLGGCGILLVVFALCVTLIYFVFSYVDASTSVGGLPVVSIGYINVSLRNDTINPDNMVMSDWDIGFTVQNQKPWSTLAYSDFNVSIQYDTGISTVAIIPGLQQNQSDIAQYSTTVQALLAPHNATTSYEVRFGVSFLSKVIEVTMTNEDSKSAYRWFGIKNEAKLFNGTCANMTITVQGNHGTVRGPVRCLDPREGQNLYGDTF